MSRPDWSTSRRRFLAGTAAIAIPAPAAGFSFFSTEDVPLLEALCEQILPSDNLPGAKEAAVVNYIDRQLAGTLKRFAPAYREGLRGLVDNRFLAQSFAQRTRLLEQAEAGRIAGVPAAFVRMITDHAMQGFFGDPKHGGNQDRVGWKLLGLADGGHGH